MGKLIKAGEIDRHNKNSDCTVKDNLEQIFNAGKELLSIKKTMKNEIIDLAIVIASKIVTRKVQMEPALLDAIYEENISLVKNFSPGVINVNPKALKATDIENISRLAGFKADPDPEISLPGCVVEVGNSVIDATLETVLFSLKESMKK